ncbi:MAG TPA: flagellin, partial [bacterium]|nr:flagellin [bacterium]
MSVRITDQPTFFAQRHLARLTTETGTSMRRLSSGLRISTAADDAAGLAISERLRARIRSLDQARRNATDGISLLRVTEGALGSVSDMLVRMRELAINARNGTHGPTDLKALDTEYQALLDEVARTGEASSFNGLSLLDGSTRT